MSEVSSPMQPLGEMFGLKFYWANDRFAQPGLYFWDGEKNVLACAANLAHTGAAVSAIAHERARQVIVEGWTPEHDDQHPSGAMACAAAAYALVTMGAVVMRHNGEEITVLSHDEPPGFWPWAKSWWKPRDRRSNLIRAGALIVAELERLGRMAEKAPA